MISNKRKKTKEDLRKEMGDKEYILDAYWGETEEYKEAKMDLAEKKTNWIDKLN